MFFSSRESNFCSIWYSIRGSHPPPTSQIWGEIHFPFYLPCSSLKLCFYCFEASMGYCTMIRSCIDSRSCFLLYPLPLFFVWRHFLGIDRPLLTFHCIGRPAIDQRQYLVFIDNDLAPISEVFPSSSRICFRPHLLQLRLPPRRQRVFNHRLQSNPQDFFFLVRIHFKSVGDTRVYPQAYRPRHLNFGRCRPPRRESSAVDAAYDPPLHHLHFILIHYFMVRFDAAGLQ